MEFLIENYSLLIFKTFEHLFISMSALFLGIIFAIPIGLIVSNNKKVSDVTIAFSSVLQTIPSLALLAMMIPIFGVGKLSAIVALFIYSLLPILRNTVLGINSVDKNIIDAAKGMGMTQNQILLKVKIPLSFQVIMSGIKLSAVYVIAWSSLASYIGAGGLGDFIFNGLNNFNFQMIISGSLVITLLSMVVDYFINLFETILVTKVFKLSHEGDLS